MPITESDLGELLSVTQAAAFYGVSRSTLYRMIADRELDVVRVGHGRGRLRITKRSLLDHMNRHVTKADPKSARTA